MTLSNAFTSNSSLSLLQVIIYAIRSSPMNRPLLQLTSGSHRTDQRRQSDCGTERHLQMLGGLTSEPYLLLNDLSRTFADMGIWSFSELDSEIERRMFMELGTLSATMNALASVVRTEHGSLSPTSEWRRAGSGFAPAACASRTSSPQAGARRCLAC